MQKIIKVYYLLDKEDKKKVKCWLTNNNKFMQELADILGVHPTQLGCMLIGARYTPQNILDKFKELGIDLGE